MHKLPEAPLRGLIFALISIGAAGCAGPSAQAEQDSPAREPTQAQPAKTPPDLAQPWIPALEEVPRAVAMRIILTNGDGSDGAYLGFDARGQLKNGLIHDPEGSTTGQLTKGYVIRSPDDQRQLLYISPQDGLLISPTHEQAGVEQDLWCRITMGARLRCQHDDEPRVQEYLIQGDRLGLMFEGTFYPGLKVEPAPESLQEQRLALLLFALYLIEHDTSSHDGDACCFE